MKSMAKEVTIRKIYLDAFIQALVKIYNSGADYVDLVAVANNTETDKIKIVVKDEYMSEEEEDEQIEDNSDLSDLDLNELI